MVQKDVEKGYTFQDGYTWEEVCANENNELVTIFKDGELVKEQSLQEIRAMLHGGAF